MEAKNTWYDIIGQRTVKSLCDNHFDAVYCKTALEAKEKILGFVDDITKALKASNPKSNTVISWGGSVTMEELGVIAAIKEGYSLRKYDILDRASTTDPAQRLEITRLALLSDIYLSGTNAITQSGELFNIDGNCNRVAAITYGPRNVIIACGANKIVKTIDDAISRVRNIVAPMNVQRFDIKTPCKTTGQCANCNSPDCICNTFVLTRHSKPANRIKVVIVGEELGF